MLVCSFDNTLLELLLSQLIYLLFILNKGKKRHCLSLGQKYLTITSSLRKNQSTAMLLFKLAMFLLLSGRSAGTNSLPEAYSLPKGSPPF
jgi:hypothetical protein